MIQKENREDLIKDNIPYVHKIVKQYFSPTLGIATYEDFIQSGIEGLIEAIDRFDPEKGSLTTYSTYWIKKKIFELIDRSRNKLSGIDRTTGSVYRIIDKIIDELMTEQGYQSSLPTNQEIKNHTKFKRVLEKSQVKSSTRPREDVILERYFLYRHEIFHYEGLSTYANMPEVESPDDFSHYLEDKTGEFEDNVCDNDFIYTLFEDNLNDKQQTVLKMHYGLEGLEPLNFREIGEILNLSRAAIYDIHKKALRLLKVAAARDKDLFLEFKVLVENSK